LVINDIVTYSSTITPIITSLTPDSGTTAGGTTVAIKGTGFGIDATKVSILFDNIPCVIQVGSSISDTDITCVTGARSRFVKSTM